MAKTLILVAAFIWTALALGQALGSRAQAALEPLTAPIALAEGLSPSR